MYNEITIRKFNENNLDFRLLKGLLHKQRVESYAEIAKSYIVFTKEYFNLKGENFYEPIEAKNLFDFGFGIINKGKTEDLKDNFIVKNHNINFEGNILCVDCENTIVNDQH